MPRSSLYLLQFLWITLSLCCVRSAQGEQGLTSAQEEVLFYVARDQTLYALDIDLRVPTDFQWQRSPCLLYGSGNVPLEYPGLDVIVPYWFGRYAGLIAAP